MMPQQKISAFDNGGLFIYRYFYEQLFYHFIRTIFFYFVRYFVFVLLY